MICKYLSHTKLLSLLLHLVVIWLKNELKLKMSFPSVLERYITFLFLSLCWTLPIQCFVQPLLQFTPSSSLLHALKGRIRITAGNCYEKCQQMSRFHGTKEDINTEDTYKFTVVFLRHGESVWNKENRFIGWQDPELTEAGITEARRAGQTLKKNGFEFDEVHTSLLKRCIKTSCLVLEEMGLEYIDIKKDWRLNERCYGALTGRNKKEVVSEHGAQQVKTWRRSFGTPPPPVTEQSPTYPGNMPKYDFLDRSMLPTSESGQDTMKRSAGYWQEVIVPSIKKGKKVLVCGHENNLRALLKYIDSISDEDFSEIELPRAQPLVYTFDSNTRPITSRKCTFPLSGRFLIDDEELERIRTEELRRVYAGAEV
mmetsp:Transcript_506/g.675  ORF Transcript_506/g.675 Transcript_506/m.675 type:complete len:369 (+) Transcript_506:1-1107(+)